MLTRGMCSVKKTASHFVQLCDVVLTLKNVAALTEKQENLHTVWEISSIYKYSCLDTS